MAILTPLNPFVSTDVSIEILAVALSCFPCSFSRYLHFSHDVSHARYPDSHTPLSFQDDWWHCVISANRRESEIKIVAEETDLDGNNMLVESTADGKNPSTIVMGCAGNCETETTEIRWERRIANVSRSISRTFKFNCWLLFISRSHTVLTASAVNVWRFGNRTRISAKPRTKRKNNQSTLGRRRRQRRRPPYRRWQSLQLPPKSSPKNPARKSESCFFLFFDLFQFPNHNHPTWTEHAQFLKSSTRKLDSHHGPVIRKRCYRIRL